MKEATSGHDKNQGWPVCQANSPFQSCCGNDPVEERSCLPGAQLRKTTRRFQSAGALSFHAFPEGSAKPGQTRPTPAPMAFGMSRSRTRTPLLLLRSATVKSDRRLFPQSCEADVSQQLSHQSPHPVTHPQCHVFSSLCLPGHLVYPELNKHFTQWGTISPYSGPLRANCTRIHK